MLRDLLLHAKRSTNAGKEACNETYECMYRDLLMHAKETYYCM